MPPIQFHRAGDDYGWLSNSAPYPITLDGFMWYTAEHYFQAQKFHDETVKRTIRKTRSGWVSLLETLRCATACQLWDKQCSSRS